ncbi:MAG: DUF3576 domain-containing protein [Proteobacteria bacterium]|nr:DUF3576 domain-containing protein [Pseudomonadota bacterium]
MTKSFFSATRRFYGIFVLGTLLAACSGGEVYVPEIVRGQAEQAADRDSGRNTIFGKDGFSLGGTPDKGTGSGSGLGVNAFLWRATLDTISVWPVSSADPFGGVIITDWYQPPEVSGERFKMNVYILDRALRADGVRVAVFRQVRDTQLGWKDAPVQRETSTRLEDAILMRARQFRNESR